MMHKWYRSVCGYVQIRITGKNARRFLNLCARQGIALRDIQKTEREDEFTCFLSKRDVFAIKPFLRKTGTHFRICRKMGLGFAAHKYRKRGAFLLSFWLMAMLFSYNAGFVWKIEIKGNLCLSEDTVIAYLKNRDYGFGARKKDINCKELELSLRKDFSEVIWSSVYLEGTKLVVELQENLIAVDPAGVNAGADGCYDLVAAKDAVIASIITRSGSPKVVCGSEVKAGDLLVGARQEILDDNGDVGTVYYASADAEVLGIVTYEYTNEFPKREELKLPTGRTKRSYFAAIGERRLTLPVFGMDFPRFRQLEEYEQLHLTDNFYLPLFGGRITYEEYETRQVAYRPEQLKQMAAEDFGRYTSRLTENGVQIIEQRATVTEEKELYRLNGVVTACEPIAMSMPAEIAGGE